MRKQFLSILLLLSLVFSIAAQKPASEPSDKNLRSHVEYLASDKFEGRRTGETGATYAAGYIANTFANYKLKTGFNSLVNGKPNANYLQTFPLVTGVLMANEGNSFSLDVTKADGQKLTFKEELAFKPVGFSPNGVVGSSEIVFAGYGIVSDELKYDDYKNLDARNKIVVAFDGGAENDSPHSAFGRYDAHTKAKIAKDKGAVGLLLISLAEKLEDDSLAKLKYDPTLGEAAIPTLIISRKSGADILAMDEAGLKQIETTLAMVKNPNVKVNLAVNSKAVVDFKVNLTKTKADAYNVVGILEGTDATLKNEAIVIGAHYDHLGRGGQGSLAVNSKEIHHGADDNASGVSAMLELARRFSKEKKNKRTLIFIAFGGEEEGLLGSQFYVNNPAFPLAKTVAMINMDMVGRLKDDKLTIGGIGTAGGWKNLIDAKNLSDGVGLAVTKLNNFPPQSVNSSSFNRFNLSLSEDGFGPSDHTSFYAKQIPVLFFFTGTHNDYHKPSDTADKINYQGLLKVTNFVGEIVKAIDANPTKPTYTVAKSSGMTGGRMGFNVSLGTVPNYADGNNDGLLLDGVRDDSPAAKSGIKPGDKIVKLAGKDIRNVSDYTIILGELKAGTEYEIVVRRGAETLTLKIVPAARK
ncbi:MAG: M20/M25/M40 family metallo-hydrolase [Pyrinomonadaceae bacterium]|nr:M20/M25/M40 family metallo-hydrolase [Pyrinomonadaceae bacterium]